MATNQIHRNGSIISQKANHKANIWKGKKRKTERQRKNPMGWADRQQYNCTQNIMWTHTMLLHSEKTPIMQWHRLISEYAWAIIHSHNTFFCKYIPAASIRMCIRTEKNYSKAQTCQCIITSYWQDQWPFWVPVVFLLYINKDGSEMCNIRKPWNEVWKEGLNVKWVFLSLFLPQYWLKCAIQTEKPG